MMILSSDAILGVVGVIIATTAVTLICNHIFRKKLCKIAVRRLEEAIKRCQAWRSLIIDLQAKHDSSLHICDVVVTRITPEDKEWADVFTKVIRVSSEQEARNALDQLDVGLERHIATYERCIFEVKAAFQQKP